MSLSLVLVSPGLNEGTSLNMIEISFALPVLSDTGSEGKSLPGNTDGVKTKTLVFTRVAPPRLSNNLIFLF